MRKTPVIGRAARAGLPNVRLRTDQPHRRERRFPRGIRQAKARRYRSAMPVNNSPYVAEKTSAPSRNTAHLGPSTPLDVA
jgi:hypothetical protein